MPPPDADEAEWLDGLVGDGHGALELPFVDGFPWNERRCGRFGELTAARGLALSIHAPYFAVLTVEDEDRRKKTISAVEYSMKLVKALGGHTVVVHAGHVRDSTPNQLHELVSEGLERIEDKVRYLGVSLGLETSGSDRAFGSLGDIALIAGKFSFVRPVIDWAHVHAKSGGALTTVDAFASVIEFLRSEFPGWAIDPLHTQFTDNEFGAAGEIRHVPYGDGSLRAGPLAAAAVQAGLRMTVISEAREMASHDAILRDLRAAEDAARPSRPDNGRPLASAPISFPDDVHIDEEGGAWVSSDLERPVRVSNPDKVMFPDDAYTKGDLVQYYASIAPLLVPHLDGRALSLARYPNGIAEDFFYEKQCPSHAPGWIGRAPIHSSHRGEPIEFCMVTDHESLMWVANLGCIEMHPWLSRAERPDAPDFAVFDLDPQEGSTWAQVIHVAGLVNVLLERLGLAGYPKTSGLDGPPHLRPARTGVHLPESATIRRDPRANDRLGGSGGGHDGVGHSKTRPQSVHRSQSECGRQDNCFGVCREARAGSPSVDSDSVGRVGDRGSG